MGGLRDTWWWAALPATLVVGKLVLGSRRPKKGMAAAAAGGAAAAAAADPGGLIAPLRVADDGQVFVCERVCTSSKLLGKLGGLAKDSYPGSCVTVCGVSDVDACQEACQRTVCVYQHQVPEWNDTCLRRCTQECVRGRTAN